MMRLVLDEADDGTLVRGWLLVVVLPGMLNTPDVIGQASYSKEILFARALYVQKKHAE